MLKQCFRQTNYLRTYRMDRSYYTLVQFLGQQSLNEFYLTQYNFMIKCDLSYVIKIEGEMSWKLVILYFFIRISSVDNVDMAKFKGL